MSESTGDPPPIEFESFHPERRANGDGEDRSNPPIDAGMTEGAVAKWDDSWPFALSGVTESLVATLGPNGRWNLAPLGLFAEAGDSESETVSATTWGRTRTRRNFERDGSGWIQFTTDPVVFVEAALSVVELDDPVIAAADAWVHVDVERDGSGVEDGIEWVRWRLQPTAADVRRTRVPRFVRGPAAVVEASVAASRLDVPGYDADRCRSVIDRAGETVRRTGDERTVLAYERLLEHAGLGDSFDDDDGRSG